MNNDVLDILRNPETYPSMRDLSKYNLQLRIIKGPHYCYDWVSTSVAIFLKDNDCILRTVRHQPPTEYAAEKFDRILGTKPYTYASDQHFSEKQLSEILMAFPSGDNMPVYEGIVIDGIYYEIKIPVKGIEHSWVSTNESEIYDKWVDDCLKLIT